MLLRVCCKCRKWLGIRFNGWKKPWLLKSHGYCAECARHEMEALNG